MQFFTIFRILNQNFHVMDLIRGAMNKRRLATAILHEDYRKIVYKLPIWLLTFNGIFYRALE